MECFHPNATADSNATSMDSPMTPGTFNAGTGSSTITTFGPFSCKLDETDDSASPLWYLARPGGS